MPNGRDPEEKHLQKCHAMAQNVLSPLMGHRTNDFPLPNPPVKDVNVQYKVNVQKCLEYLHRQKQKEDVKCPRTLDLNTVEAIEPSQTYKEAVTQLATKLPKRQRKTTPRKELALKIKDMDPAECGPPCATAPVPDQILKLKQEFADVFPEKMPPGLPPERRTDHRIDFFARI